MKRAGNLIAAVADMDNLRLAFWKARKGKSYAANVEAYRENLGDNLLLLRQQILSGQVDVGQYRQFKIFDPKERTISAPSFQEQVLHHALMNVCHPFFEKKQLYDSYACRKGKGTYKALERAKGYTKKYKWFLKLDVFKFFDSIHHEVLKSQLEKMIKDKAVCDIFGEIIDSYEASPQRGLPIGNLSSQYFANHSLHTLDHHIKVNLKVKAYVRYMDDMVLWAKEKTDLQVAFWEIKAFVENALCCALKPKLLNLSAQGLPFLGYQLFPNKTRLSRRSARRFSLKMGIAMENWNDGTWDDETAQRHVLPLLAFTKHATVAPTSKSARAKLSCVAYVVGAAGGKAD